MSDLGNKQIMAANLNRMMKERGKERSDLCRDLGFPYTTVTDWLKANTYPRIDKIEMMADYFHVEKAELVESQETLRTMHEKAQSRIEKEADAIAKAYTEADEKTKRIVRQLLDVEK